MDYSLLLGIHRIGVDKDKLKDEQSKSRKLKRRKSGNFLTLTEQMSNAPQHIDTSSALEASVLGGQLGFDAGDDFEGGIRAKLREVQPDGDVKEIPVLVFLGIIDILQSYGVRKKLEHSWKSMLHDGATVSVHNPTFYGHRFLKYMTETVFQADPRLGGAAAVSSPRGKTTRSKDKAPAGASALRNSASSANGAASNNTASPYFRRGVSPNGPRPKSGEGGADGARASDGSATDVGGIEAVRISGTSSPQRPTVSFQGLESVSNTDILVLDGVGGNGTTIDIGMLALNGIGGSTETDDFDDDAGVEAFLAHSPIKAAFVNQPPARPVAAAAATHPYQHEPESFVTDEPTDQQQVAHAHTVSGILQKRSNSSLLSTGAGVAAPAQVTLPEPAVPIVTVPIVGPASAARAALLHNGEMLRQRVASIGASGGGVAMASTPSPGGSEGIGGSSERSAAATAGKRPANVRNEHPGIKTASLVVIASGRARRQLPSQPPAQSNAEGTRLRAKIDAARNARRSNTGSASLPPSAVSTPIPSPHAASSPLPTVGGSGSIGSGGGIGGLSFLQNESMTSDNLSFLQNRSMIGDASPVHAAGAGPGGAYAGAAIMSPRFDDGNVVPDPSDWDAATDALKAELASTGGKSANPTSPARASFSTGASPLNNDGGKGGREAGGGGNASTLQDHTAPLAGTSPLSTDSGTSSGALSPQIASPGGGLSFLQNESMQSDNLSFLQNGSVLGDLPPSTLAPPQQPQPTVFRSVSMEMAHHRNSPGILSAINNPGNAQEMDDFMAMEQYAMVGGATPDLTGSGNSTPNFTQNATML
jgi:hypothetical protein